MFSFSDQDFVASTPIKSTSAKRLFGLLSPDHADTTSEPLVFTLINYSSTCLSPQRQIRSFWRFYEEGMGFKIVIFCDCSLMTPKKSITYTLINILFMTSQLANFIFINTHMYMKIKPINCCKTRWSDDRASLGPNSWRCSDQVNQ